MDVYESKFRNRKILLCNIHSTKCGHIKCKMIKNNNEICWSGCKYLNKFGCTIKSLGCKFWFCDKILLDINIYLKYSSYFKSAKRIIDMADKFNIPLTYRETFNDTSNSIGKIKN